jgi:hypothetical protein
VASAHGFALARKKSLSRGMGRSPNRVLEDGLKKLDERLERWARDGLITIEQARAIQKAEEERERTAARGSTPALTEVVAYAGAICLLSGASVIASRIWPRFGVVQQLLLLGGGTILLWAGGWWIRADPRPALQRLATGLWFLSVGGVGWFAAALSDHLLEQVESNSLIVGVSTSLYGGALFLTRRTSLQQIGVAGGVAYLCAGVSDLGSGEDTLGILLWIAGAMWIALTRANLLTPRRTGFVLGALGVLGGSEALAIEFFEATDWWGLALGVLSSAALLYLSVVFREMVLLGFGTAGLFVFLIQIISEYLADGLGGPLSFFVAGTLLLVIALVTARLRNRVATQ